MTKNLTNYFIAGVMLFLTTTACQEVTTPKDKTDHIERKIDALLAKMTLEEKIGQTAQRGTSSREKNLPEELKTRVRNGEVGSLLNVMNVEHVKELQKIAVEESPNGIPLIFARDVIHGFKTIFPIPLGQAASWNPDLVQKGARIAAIEASNVGIRWTFAPMLDISRDGRWGRIAESSGEDPYLTSQMAKAYIQGFQTDDLSNPNAMAACAKHFVGYGAAEGGRDYNTAIISENLLQNVYLRPFKTAVDAGVATFMTGFNELNGVPVSGNKFLLDDVLRQQWSFDGFVVSDWNSITEMIPHGYAEDEREAALRSLQAGLDMEMTSRAYELNLKELVDEGLVSEAQINNMARNILRIKFRLGLFDNPYFKVEADVNYREDHLAKAKEAALQSMVLLKNDDVLPLENNNQKIAVIGPLAHASHEQLGTWTFDGDKNYTQTPLAEFKKQIEQSKLLYSEGLSYSRDLSDKGFRKALAAARKSDVIVFFGGEEAILSGEAHSRAEINLPGRQEELISALAALGKPIILVVMAGRPITLGNILDKVDAVIMAWHPGTMGGPAVVDLLLGKSSPSGRLPITWPKQVGQIPIYYNHKNTGRPADEKSFVHLDSIAIGAWQSSLGNSSHYLDVGYEPQYPFGYGLTYSSFEYRKLTLNAESLSLGDTLMVDFELSNTGERDGTEVVQLYVQDKFGSLTRPVRELKSFKRVVLDKKSKTKVIFKVPVSDLAFFNQNGAWEVEPGEFNVWVGPNAAEGIMSKFNVMN